jgi:hypothetical protein
LKFGVRGRALGLQGGANLGEDVGVGEDAAFPFHHRLDLARDGLPIQAIGPRDAHQQVDVEDAALAGGGGGQHRAVAARDRAAEDVADLDHHVANRDQRVQGVGLGRMGGGGGGDLDDAGARLRAARRGQQGAGQGDDGGENPGGAFHRGSPRPVTSSR